MAENTKLSALAVNAEARALAELLANGFFDLMTGEQPASADEPPEFGDEQRLARCQFSAIAFAAPKDGVLTANPISKSIAIRGGKPTWFRASTSNGEAVIDGSVGKRDANGVVKVSAIVEGQVVSISKFVHRVVKTRTEQS